MPNIATREPQEAVRRRSISALPSMEIPIQSEGAAGKALFEYANSVWLSYLERPPRAIEPFLATRYGETGYSPALNDILSMIEESRKILDWMDDWDEERSPGYTEDTWRRATDFVRRNAADLWYYYGIIMDPPKVLPGPNGSIDIHWQGPNHELLINVPPDINQMATFYGDDRSGNIIKGRLNTSTRNQWLIMWLME